MGLREVCTWKTQLGGFAACFRFLGSPEKSAHTVFILSES